MMFNTPQNSYQADLIARLTGGNTGIAGPNGSQIGRYQTPGMQAPEDINMQPIADTLGLPNMQKPPVRTVPYGSAGQQIADAYKQHLGRDAGDYEIAGQLGGGRATGAQNVAHALRMIQGSPEAQAYAKAQAAKQTPDLAGDTPPAKEAPARNPNALSIGGFDMGKVGNQAEMAKSPKYQFATLANSGQYGAQDGAKLLADLQAQYGDHWKNVTYDGRDKFKIGPGAHADWGDADLVDFMAAHDQNAGTAKDFYWGVEGPTSRAEASRQSGGSGGGMGAMQGGLHQLLTGNPTAGIQAALGQQAGQSDFLAALLKQLGAA
jgi:hypothetical protein